MNLTSTGSKGVELMIAIALNVSSSAVEVKQYGV